MIKVLKILKVITALLSTEATPSVSMIMPLKTQILEDMQPNEDDSATVRDIKAAIRQNLGDQILYKCLSGLSPQMHSS